MPVNVDQAELLALVACPSCRAPLAEESGRFRCTDCARAYAVEDRVPVLDEGAAPDPSLMVRVQYAVLGNPRVYELHQRYGGGRPIAAQVQRHLHGVGRGTLIDVGAGTGMVGTLLPSETRYVWLDNDRLKLRGFLAKEIDALAVLGDAARLPFASDSADWTVMVEVSHHLSDAALRRCFAEAARVTRDRFVFVDALRGSRLRSKVLWQLDLGRFPRPEEDVLRALDESFEVKTVERFRVNHDHLLCICVPKATRPLSSGE